MGIKVGNFGTVRNVKELTVGVRGAKRTVKTVFVKAYGSVRKCFEGVPSQSVRVVYGGMGGGLTGGIRVDGEWTSSFETTRSISSIEIKVDMFTRLQIMEIKTGTDPLTHQTCSISSFGGTSYSILIQLASGAQISGYGTKVFPGPVSEIRYA